MSIVSRYVFRQAAGTLVLILSTLSGIVWIALALRELNVVTAQGQDALMLLKMTTLALPNLMAIIAPVALLIATIHTLNRLSGDSELIVLTAAGATVWTIARPLISLALLVAVCVGLVNHFAMPWSLRLLRQYIIEIRTDLLTQVIQPGRFSAPEPNLTFHIRERTLNGELLGLIMHDARDEKLTQSYLAERGIIVKQEPTAYLVMTDGHIIRRTDKNEPAQIVAFDKYAVDLDRFEHNDEETQEFKPRERYFHELIDPGADSWFAQRLPGSLRAELHERFSSPFYPIAFVMIALAAMGHARTTRQNRVERLVMGFLGAVALRMIGLAVNNLVVLKASALFLLYGLPLGAILLSMIFISRGARPGRGLGLSARLGEWFGPLVRVFTRPRLASGQARG